MDDNIIKDSKKKIIFKVSSITEVHPRRYNAVLNSIEIFLNTGKVYYFCLYEK